MKKYLLLVAVAGLLLSACGPIKSDGHMGMMGLDPQLCGAPRTHCRPVIVDNGAIVPIEDVIVDSANHQIYWEIKTGGYVFPADWGIQLKKDLVSPYQNEITCNRVGTKIFHCTDRNTTRARYEYKVRVTRTDGSGELILDPFIVNN